MVNAGSFDLQRSEYLVYKSMPEASGSCHLCELHHMRNLFAGQYGERRVNYVHRAGPFNSA